MNDAGIDISQHKSELIDLEILNKADYVITLCGDANDKCPVTPRHVNRLHWGFEDPAKATGTEAEITAKFRQVRDAMKDRIANFLTEEVRQ